MSLSGLFGTAIGQDAQGEGGGEGGDPSRLPVKDKDLTAPPGAPSVGDRYIVASVATGVWAGHENDIAEWAGAAWTFETPVIGWITYVEDETEYYSWNGTAWVQESAGLHATTHEDGGTDEVSVGGLSGELADPQPPKAHAADHENGGTDEVGVGGLSGELADPQPPKTHAADHENGGTDEIGVGGLSGELADPQPPKTHAADHENGGTDEIGVGGLSGELADPQPPKTHAASHKDGGADEVATVTPASGAIPKADGTGKLPIGFMPGAVVGGLNYQGTWDANANTPTLASGVGTKGYYYVVSTPGSTNLDGITDWKANDWAVFNGTTWEKIDNTDQVTSVFTRTGAVVAASGDYTHAQTSGQTTDDHHAQQHALGGSDHTTATLAELNAKVSDATLDDSGDPRDPNAHAASHKDGGTDELNVEDFASAGTKNGIATSDGSGAVNIKPRDPVKWYDAARLDGPDGTSDVPNSMNAAPIANDSIASNIPVREFPDDVEKGVLLESTVRVPPGSTVMQLHIAGHAKIAPTPSATTLVLKMYTRKHKNGVARGAWGAASSIATFSIPTNTYDVITFASKTLNAWNLLPDENFQICVSRDPLDASDDLAGDFELRRIGLEIY